MVKTKRRRRNNLTKRRRRRNNLGGHKPTPTARANQTRRPSVRTRRPTGRNNSPPGVSPHNWRPTAQANQTRTTPIRNPQRGDYPDDPIDAPFQPTPTPQFQPMSKYQRMRGDVSASVAQAEYVKEWRKTMDKNKEARLQARAQAEYVKAWRKTMDKNKEARLQARAQAEDDRQRREAIRQRTGRREVVLQTLPQVELFQYPSPTIPQANDNLRSLVFPNQTLVQLPPTIANVNVPNQQQQIVSVIGPNLMRESPPQQEEESYCTVMG